MIGIFTGIMAFIVISVLFIKPYVGMADNGDFFREIHNVGLYYLTESFDDRHFGYFNMEYGIRQYPFERTALFVSSLTLMIRTALALDLWFTQDNLFDIRTLAILYGIVFITAFYLLLKNFADRMTFPLIIATSILAIMIFGDAGYISYFSSFYGEPASYVFLLLTLAFGFRLLRDKKPSVGEYVLFFLSAAVFIAAKQQNAPIGLLFAIVSVRLLSLRKDKLWKIVIGSTTVLLLSLSAFIYLAITDGIGHINQYHTVTRGILEDSPNPERDMEELGLDKKFSLLAGTTYYDKYSIENSESALMNERFYPNAGYGAVIKFYLLHMDRAFGKLDLAAKHAYTIRPLAIGNYEKSERKGYGAKTNDFVVWSSLKEKLFPKSFRFILLFYALYFGSLLKFYVDRFKNGNVRGMIRLELFGLVGLIGLIQLSVSFLGAGDADLAKHLFLFNVCFDFMFVSVVVYSLNSLYVKYSSRRKAGASHWKPKSSISG
ncbi:glycan biosynthesis hexose transferase WsfD [Cohnella herbarum]|uniref:Transmembrane protein n=1 Tax=Cohnella herbarum TaxID=2728023 RepID=A0A7Z2VIR3_9BACL|nr:hypothetical protein [Cohnella herbarum]QJD83609.1 hypothetical protein HH215_10755 [Cohnella herbarum]